MIQFLVQFLVAVIIFGLLYWIIGMIPLPEPFKRIALVILVVVMCLWLIFTLLGFVGMSPALYPHYR